MMVLAELYNTSRAAERRVIEADATLRSHDQAPVDILVANISSTGCLFVCPEVVDLDARILIGIPHLGRREARVVRVLDRHYGCEFLSALSDEDVAAASIPGDTVVPFPFLLIDASSTLDDLSIVTKLPGWARLIVLVGATLTIWLCIVALVVCLR